jgi:polyferredoxin
MRKYLFPIGILLVFESIAIALWLASDSLFYLFNFTYIGVCVAAGVFLRLKKIKYARNAVQLSVGLYLLVFLHFVDEFENMQLEGFWYYLFLGVFQAATIHYAVAKIIGPLFFGRGWCGYACWTAMVLDLLPFATPRRPRRKSGYAPHVLFAVSFAFVALLFLLRAGNMAAIMFWSFIIGNLLYYAAGIAMAFSFKDNRAFCKYICPVTVFLRPASYFALVRVQNDKAKCVSCGLCRKACPMDVDMTDNSRSRSNGTDCILCCKCVDACPVKSLRAQLL